jgi:hypothetical protein
MLLCRPDAPRIETLNDMDCYVANFWRATSIDPEAVAFHADSPVNEADLHARHRWLVLSPAAADFRERMRREPDYFDAKVAGWWCWGLCCWIGSGWCSTANEVERNEGSTPVLQGSHANGQGVVNASAAINSAEWKQRPALEGWNGDGQGAHGVNAAPPLKQKIPANATERANGKGVNVVPIPELSQKLPLLNAGGNHVEATGRGVNGLHEKRPPLGDGRGVGGQKGVNQDAPDEKRIQLSALSERDLGTGVHKVSSENKPPRAPQQNGNCTGGNFSGVLGDANRPQLADAYARGRGVHGHDDAGTCEQRRRWLLNWFSQLRDRLRTVRVCCGDWLRVCDSHSVTTRLGLTGLFFDPPYSTEAGRDNSLYAVESGTVAHDVRAYCLERGDDPLMRICLAGYAGEGHEALEAAGWSVVAWRAAGGYGNRKGSNDNAAKERLWFSPHCLVPGNGIEQGSLFA